MYYCHCQWYILLLECITITITITILITVMTFSDISKFASDLSSYWEIVNMRNSVLGEETRNAVMVSLDKVMKVFDRFFAALYFTYK